MQPTKNQKAIYKLLTTSTGSALCDSGGAYGRHWQRNQARTVQDFIDEPEVSIKFTYYRYDGKSPPETTIQNTISKTIYHSDIDPTRVSNTEYSYTISMFHWLDRYFDIANESHDPFIDTFNRLEYDKQDEYLESIHFQKGDTHNSYNGDSNLSQVYQLTPIFPINEEYSVYEHQYYLLSIHQGCDVRGGYTTDIMVRIDMDEGYPYEFVHGTATCIGDDTTEYSVSNSYDGTAIRFEDDHPTLRDQEIDPALVSTLTLSL